MAKVLYTVLVVFFLTNIFASKISLKYDRKQLAGPPSGFKGHALPNPADASIEETTAEIEVFLNFKDYTGGNDLLSQHDILCDSAHFMIIFFSPYDEKIELKLFDPNGKEVNLADKLKTENFPIADSGEGVPALYSEFHDAIIGTYVLKIYAKPGQIFTPVHDTVNPQPNAYIMTYSESPFVIYTHVNQFMIKTHKDVGLLTRIGDARLARNGSSPAIAKSVIVDDAEMEVELPDGTQFQVKMHDDGLHDDFEAGDGIYGATFKPDTSGMYRLRADVFGRTADGVKFLRSTQHVLPVIQNDISFVGKAIGRFTDPKHIVIEVLLNNASPVDETYVAYAEVWGISKLTKKEISICWIEGLADIGNDGGVYYIPLNLDLSWLRLPGMDSVDYNTIFLKNVRVHDTDYTVPLTTSDRIAISFPKDFISMVSQIPLVTEITHEMRNGPLPESLKQAAMNRTMGNGKGGVIVLHGYCSKDNPFFATPKSWSNAYFFNDLKKNRNHNDFSLKVLDFAKENGLDSYSLVGHSQGGMVGLHVLNFFFSGVDIATKGRLVQAVGTPYYGNTGAGCLADLIKIFGFSCGSNFDISREGSALWLSTIADDNKKEVNYYTTSYRKFPFCNLITYVALKKPNDGTAELTYCHLEHATNHGDKEGYCHSPGMTKPAQTHDAQRNSEMSSKAAR